MIKRDRLFFNQVVVLSVEKDSVQVPTNEETD